MWSTRKKTVSYATRDDGWRTKWQEQLQQWERNKGDGPTIEVYIGAILGTSSRSEAALVGSKCATSRRWEAFVKAEPTYVKRLRRFASSLRITSGKDRLDVPYEGAREVKLHLWLNADQTARDSKKRKHGPHSFRPVHVSARRQHTNSERSNLELTVSW